MTDSICTTSNESIRKFESKTPDISVDKARIKRPKRADLNNKENIHHNLSLPAENFKTDESSNKSNIDCLSRTQYSCKNCDKTYVRLYHYSQHLKSCTESSTPVIQNILPTQNIEENPFKVKQNQIPRIKKKKHVCKTCNKVFSLKENLIKHFKIHRKENNLSNEVKEEPLNTQISSSHLGDSQRIDKKFTCNTCAFKCRSLSGLTRHKKKIHKKTFKKIVQVHPSSSEGSNELKVEEKTPEKNSSVNQPILQLNGIKCEMQIPTEPMQVISFSNEEIKKERE